MRITATKENAYDDGNDDDYTNDDEYTNDDSIDDDGNEDDDSKCSLNVNVIRQKCS